MSDKETGDPHLHRLVLFSDAVFAIAITLLAIEIHPPEHWNGIGELFALMAPKLAAYAVSFAVIAIYWVSHRRTFTHLLRADFVLDILNFLMLGLLALLPLTTELLWENNGRGDAVLVYVGLVAVIGLAHGLTWAYAALLGGLVTPALSLATRLFILLRVALLPGLMCGLTIVSLA
ncbi:MAG: TMEM175 family protein, partial [bacterium]|nr:TMEM175 family protein [bacterium]